MGRRILLVGALIALLLGLQAWAWADRSGYRPVAPVSVLLSAVASNLKQVETWLDDDDFTSARQTAQGVSTLVWLLGQQGADVKDQASWRALQQSTQQLTETLRMKSTEASRQHLQASMQALAQLEKAKLTPAKTAVPNWRPAGNLRTWMLLMEFAYADGKTARSAKQMERYALEVAEEANAVSFLRGDAGWRKMSEEVRETALQAAQQARGGDLEKARQAFRAIYVKCEVCHQGSR